MTDIPWDHGTWTHPPVAARVEDGALQVTAVEGSDAWRTTSYGFVHESEHALLAPFPQDSAMEVEFTADFSAQFDQTGIFVRAAADHWIKAGVELSDGSPQLGAVVTHPFSDWSLAPVPEWLGRRIRVRVSRAGDALTVRAGLADPAGAGSPLRLVRVIPFAPDLAAEAGPFVCAPTRSGLRVALHAWRRTTADAALHDEA